MQLQSNIPKLWTAEKIATADMRMCSDVGSFFLVIKMRTWNYGLLKKVAIADKQI
jgi:hypothetical protein